MSKIKLVQGYSEEVIQKIIKANIKVKAVVTDPPYEISNSGGGMMDRDNRNFIREIDSLDMCQSTFDVKVFLESLKPLFPSKQEYCGVFFCSKSQVFDYLTFAEENKLQYGIGVWHKTNPAPLCNFKYLNDLEYWIYIKGKKSKILGTYATKSMLYSSSINMKDKKEFDHPTIKPLELIRRFITNHTEEGDLVIDPYMGSGSTGVVCKEMNRDFIGIELVEQHFNTSTDRINNTEENKK